jgi:hypothetical protein
MTGGPIQPSQTLCGSGRLMLKIPLLLLGFLSKSRGRAKRQKGWLLGLLDVHPLQFAHRMAPRIYLWEIRSVVPPRTNTEFFADRLYDERITEFPDRGFGPVVRANSLEQPGFARMIRRTDTTSDTTDRIRQTLKSRGAYFEPVLGKTAAEIEADSKAATTKLIQYLAAGCRSTSTL